MIFVEVYTKSCAWCRKLERQVLSKPKVQAYLKGKFVPVRLDAEDRESRVQIGNRALTHAAEAYGVKSFPTTLFLEPNGQLIYALKGYHPEEEYLKFLQYFGNREFEDRKSGK